MKFKTIASPIFAVAALGSFAITAFAQKSDINRVEFFGGFSYHRVESPYASEDLAAVDQVVGGTSLSSNLGKSYGMNGANIKITGNFAKYIGAQFDFSTHTNNRSFAAGASNLSQKYTFSNFLGGIQIKNNAKEGPRAKPFGNVLVGVARQSIALNGLQGPLATFFGANQLSESQTNFALAVGGGLDVRVHKNVDIRVFQIDYNPTYIKETDDFSGKIQNNVRFSFGIVIH